MLSHLSSKFSASPSQPDRHERRAAIFLNRYTRTLTVVHATDGLADILGISGKELRGKSFYYCIQENCLKDAVRCLENAKTNDSIAYLRFWYRDPRQDESRQMNDQPRRSIENQDSVMEDVSTSDDDWQTSRGQFNRRGHHLQQDLRNANSSRVPSEPVSSSDSLEPLLNRTDNSPLGIPPVDRTSSSSDSSNSYSHEAVFGEPESRDSSASPLSASPNTHNTPLSKRTSSQGAVELEAVVSSSSDGLVVCLRQAAHFDSHRPAQQSEQQPVDQGFTNGLFAVPWAREPMLPSLQQRNQGPQNPGLAPSLAPPQAYHRPIAHSAKPPRNDFMGSIRDCAVFAWALIGINGSLADYSKGNPCGESQPSSGLPAWQPEARKEPSPRQDMQIHPRLSGLRSDFSTSEPTPSSTAT